MTHHIMRWTLRAANDHVMEETVHAMTYTDNLFKLTLHALAALVAAHLHSH